MMPLTRRDFLRQIGIGAASLASAWILEGCSAVGILAPAATRSAPTGAPTAVIPATTPMPAPTPAVPPIAARLGVDASRVVGALDAKLWANLGYDPMYSLTTASTSQPAWELVRESRAFRYIRCHNTFSDGKPGARSDQTMGCRVYSETASGAPRYNFQYLDQVLDTWHAVGLKPILEMDFMPDALAAGAIVQNYSGGAINSPRDYARWREMIYQTVKHCIGRYGADEVRSWYFEIWNEPDLSQYFIDGAQGGLAFTPARMARFNQMYDYFVDGATAADAQIRVGGPGLAGHNDFFKLFLDHITSGVNAVTGKIGARADFISWHVYNTNQAVLEKNRQRRAVVRSYPALAQAELLQDEWGQKLRTVEDGLTPTVLGEYDAAFLCRTIDNNLNDADARVDLFLRWGNIANGWRAFTRQFGSALVPLPIFNAYTLLGKLGAERIAVDGAPLDATIRAIAARSGAATQIVVYRFEENNADGTGAPVGVELMVNGLAGDSLSMQHYRIDREHANAYRAWLALNSPKNPTSVQSDQIAMKAMLAPESSVVAVQNGVARLAFGMLPNAM